MTACADKKAPISSEENQVIKTIMERRSVRKYAPHAVAKDTMEIILDCGINAPNAMNRQSWEIRVVDMNKHPEFAGALLEAMSSYGYTNVIPEYYEIALKRRTSRDEESSAMLDLIFATRTYDFGWYFEIGGYNEGIMNLLRAYSSDVTSMYEKSQKVANKVLSKYNEAIIELIEQEG
jgi:nitroreductase